MDCVVNNHWLLVTGLALIVLGLLGGLLVMSSDIKQARKHETSAKRYAEEAKDAVTSLKYERVYERAWVRNEIRSAANDCESALTDTRIARDEAKLAEQRILTIEERIKTWTQRSVSGLRADDV